jgi:hypothetical protein
MDHILKTHFDAYRDRGELPPELRHLKGVRLFADRDQLKIWRNNFEGIRWKDASGNLIRGAIDNLLEGNDELIVLDYKTRGFPLKDDTADHYQDQLDLYNFLLRKNGFQTANRAYLLFYFPDKVAPTGEVVFHTNLVERAIDVGNAARIIDRARTVLAADLPDADKECEYCKYKSKTVEKVDL